MKLYFVLYLLFLSFKLFAQVDFSKIENNWIEGKIDSSGKIIRANLSKAGWYSLDIKSDSVIYRSPFACGMGYEIFGTWKLNQADSTIICTYYNRKKYLSHSLNPIIDQVNIFKIERLNSTELILSEMVKGQQTVLMFIPE